MNATQIIQAVSSLLSQPWAVFIWGAPGIGKSSIIRQIAEEKGLPVVDIRASLLDPTDLRGIPAIKGGQAVWCPPSFLPKRGERPGILFLDEINAAPPLVQAALYQLILDRRIGEYVLPDGWKIIAAGNRAEDRAVTFRLSSALSNRFIHLELETDSRSWLAWAVKHRIHPVICAFIRINPKLLFVGSDIQKKSFATPRTWEMLSDVIETFGSPEKAKHLFSGIIGEGPAIEFSEFLKNAEISETLDGLIKDPDGELPTEPDRLFLLVSYIVSRIREPEVFRCAEILIGRLPPEYSVVLIRDAMNVRPDIIRNKHYQEFMRGHKEMFL